ncbi:hypothetical protein B9479_004447 [Cryptococcus floricola]|uniref:Nitrogen permease regulator 3 n=1 Tax=Cryptococcus floricola TaxID=2591691 RepID=A0A5D3AYB7_9TREE|nr:hypothetical protein B9479_004447 [Cryptococcus floricola]
MAENILGLLLVTSSSRGRHVFRYPPDPASPNVRLAQPIYPSATFTATDPDIEYKHPRAGGVGSSRRRGFDDRSSNASIRRSLFGPSTRGSSKTSKNVKKDKKKGDDLRQRYMNPLAEGNDSAYEEESDQGEDSDSSSSESDYEPLWKAGSGGPQETSGTTGKTPHRQTSGDDDHKAHSGLRSLDHSTLLGPSRRGSSSTTTPTVVGMDNGDKDAQKKAIESQYNYALGWPLEVLADMLTPPRAACNRRFELCVGNVVFLGHPVCAGPDGKWEIPPDDDELEERAPSRGRRMKDQPVALTSLDTVVEGNEAYTSTIAPGDADPKRKPTKEDVPNLVMFHLVIIIDKPDPRPGTESHDEHHTHTLGVYDEIYREIAFKWTAAAYRLQCESNLVAKEAWMIVKYKEKCLADGVGITECCRWTAAHCHIDRTLNYLYLRLHQLRTHPTNGLHSYLPTTITNRLSYLLIETILSPRPANSDEAWAHWGELSGMLSDEGGSDDEESSDGEEEWGGVVGGRAPELNVKPWQTLLLIDDGNVARQDAVHFGIIGLPAESVEIRVDGRKSPDKKALAAEVESYEDETELLQSLLAACDVTKPLYEIAHLLRYDLEGIVIPLARDLVQNKRAMLIDVVNPRLRTVVMPTTIDEHGTSFDQYSARFTREFPDLPRFARLISALSLEPVPFRKVIPGSGEPSHATRQKYMSALLWMLKQDLVVQVHTRARVFAKKEVMAEAWKRLWYRRRNRWLNIQKNRKEKEKETQGPQSPSGSDLITPRASESYPNPIDALISTTPQNKTTVPPPNHSAPKAREYHHSFLSYDPALEMDSDEEFDGVRNKQQFSEEVEHPSKNEIPSFESSFIFKPARAQKDEARWLRVIRGRADEVWASKFDLCVQYFDGVTTFEEITYRTGLQRKELEKILQLYSGDVVTFVHP